MGATGVLVLSITKDFTILNNSGENKQRQGKKDESVLTET